MKKLVLLFFFLTSCASFKNVSGKAYIDKNSRITVLPLINNSETPLSGFKAKNIIENELFSKNLNIILLDLNLDDDNISEKDLSKVFQTLKEKNIDYVFYGYVNEWRYKAGIDSEPAVSLTVNLYDLKNSEIIWSGSASKTTSSYKSLGIVSQKLIKKLLSDVEVK